MNMESESETGDSDSVEQFPLQHLRQRLDTVETGDRLDVTYRSRRSGGEITASGEVTDVKDNNVTVWWADIATEDGRTIRVEDNGDVETVRGDGQAAILGPVTDFQREGVEEPEVMTDGGTRGRDPQGAWERQMTMDALREHADRNPGAVIEVGSDRMADLSDEPGHVQTVLTDSYTNVYGTYHKRVRVVYIQYGNVSDVTDELESERVPSGDLTPEDVEDWAMSTHVEFIAKERRERLDDLTERVERYITDRWDPDWKQRERVSGNMGGPGE